LSGWRGGATGMVMYTAAKAALGEVSHTGVVVDIAAGSETGFEIF
jgi:hypothetical protein